MHCLGSPLRRRASPAVDALATSLALAASLALAVPARAQEAAEPPEDEGDGVRAPAVEDDTAEDPDGEAQDDEGPVGNPAVEDLPAPEEPPPAEQRPLPEEPPAPEGPPPPEEPPVAAPSDAVPRDRGEAPASEGAAEAPADMAPTPQEEPPREEEIFRWPNTVGPFLVEAGDGRLRLALATQFRLELASLERRDGSNERETDFAILIRRLRPALSGRFLEDRLTFLFALNTTPGAFELVDMWLDIEVRRMLRVRGGQFKVPYTRYRAQSFTRLLLADWAQTTNFFGSERQLGAVAHATRADARLDYAVGVFTGQNRRAGHAVGLPRFYGEPVTNPSLVSGVGEVDSVHPEVVGSIRWASPNVRERSLSDARRGPLRYLVAASIAWDARPEEARDFTLRAAPELWLKVEGLSVVVLGHVGLVQAAMRDALLAGAFGTQVSVAYRPVPNWEVAVRFARTDTTALLRDDARARADAIIAQAPDDDRADLERQYEDAGRLRVDQELGVGFNYFIIGHSLEWQIDVAWLYRSLRQLGDVHDLRARTHLQFAF